MKPPDDVNPSKQQNNDSYIFKFGVTYRTSSGSSRRFPPSSVRRRSASIRKNVRHLEQEIEGRIVGVNPDFVKMTGQQIEDGRFLTDADLFYRANVAVLGAEAAEKLFPYGDPVGKTIRVGEDHYFRIVGVTSYKAPSAGTGSSLAAQDFNKDVYIPLTTDRARFGEVIENEKQGSFTAERIELSQITVTVDSMENVKRTAAGARQHARPVSPQEGLRASRSRSSCWKRPRPPSGSSTWCWARSPASRSWSAGSGS